VLPVLLVPWQCACFHLMLLLLLIWTGSER
jgi:hypothetical protein